MTDVQKLRRKLTAVMVADMKGYSCMVRDDEEASYWSTAECLDVFRREISSNCGRIIRVAGDGLLAEFDSIVVAVEVAIAVQKQISLIPNRHRENNFRPQFRIGVNVGDVIDVDGMLHGDAVNIAARLEAFADPGAICISDVAYNMLKNKLKCGFRYLGEHNLKNIAEPVGVYQIHFDNEADRRRPTMRPLTSARTHSAKPSICVRPFVSLQQRSQCDSFSDGMTEDVIVNLSRFHELSVTSRDTAMMFHDRGVTNAELAQRINVQYVVDGCIRRQKGRLRMTVQLVDALSNQVVWSDQFDENMHDVFIVQQTLTSRLVSKLPIRIEQAEQSKAFRVHSERLEAYHCYLRGNFLLYQYGRASNEEAKTFFRKAMDLDPSFARAHATLSRAFHFDWRYGWCTDPDQALRTALESARTAVALDSTDARGYAEMGFAYLYLKQQKPSICAYERALSLNPNDADVLADYADALSYVNRADDAIACVLRAIELNPYHPDWYLWNLADVYFVMGDYAQAIQTVNRMNNPSECYRLLAACYALSGAIEEAQFFGVRVLEQHPEFTVEQWVDKQPDTVPEVSQRFARGLLLAGLP
ncbi:tetratricopeptide repeat protein (plasmid) [Skermanella sp. TT6]|uniref:Tetratricopeptide repeat protein n=1 Tax=Skermanella cutis TaxID=2775420 RepID=A0ABX7BG79_9PROT|nr:tetratricopeptide repeat protein [Skermanella sp. TT6]QQP93208.1 tetratricopeptide repeat protein [Skermanella sp. TT6]